MATLTEPAQEARSALDALLESHAFEDGAVVVQIPQVPPDLIDRDVARHRGYFAYPPQSLFYISACLRELGVPTRLVDLNYEVLRAAQEDDADLDDAWQTPLDKALAAFEHPLVCVSFMFDPTYGDLERVCRYVKEQRPEACVAVGGVAATADPERLLEEGLADLVVSNEGELPLRNLYAYLRGRRETLPNNLSLRANGKGVLHTQRTSGGEVDLDIRQEYDALPVADYHKIGSLNNFSRMRGIDVPYATVISRRGCRARCTFCAVRNFNGKSVRVRAHESVVDELEYLHDRHGVRHFDWLDDDLLYDADEALAMFREIARRLPDMTWAAHNGLIAAAVTPDLLEAMQESKCIGFGVGLETGDPEMLRKVRKPATIETFLRFSDLSKRYPKLYYLVNFILGLPEERFAQMMSSFDVAARAQLDWNNFFTYQPLKNTDAYVAYGGMDDGADAEDLRRRGTTMNFNPVRAGAFRDAHSDVAMGYEVFDLDPSLVPDTEQRTEIWFTFNYIANFIRMPALTTPSEDRVRNAIRWMRALGTAYADNPSIDCVVAYLVDRLGEDADAARVAARAKLAGSAYWHARDQQFGFSSLLDGELPRLDARVAHYFADRCPT